MLEFASPALRLLPPPGPATAAARKPHLSLSPLQLLCRTFYTSLKRSYYICTSLLRRTHYKFSYKIFLYISELTCDSDCY